MKDQDLLKEPKKMLPGSGISWHKFKKPSSHILQTFPNPISCGEVTVRTKEMTALCPLTGFPDQYEVQVYYIPKAVCVESKSAKFYFGAYRDFPGFIETICEMIAVDWMEASNCARVEVNITMNPRGGVAITARSTKHESAK
jgi:7-cyano-7-deazaguanine reductase